VSRLLDDMSRAERRRRERAAAAEGRLDEPSAPELPDEHASASDRSEVPSVAMSAVERAAQWSQAAPEREASDTRYDEAREYEPDRDREERDGWDQGDHEWQAPAEAEAYEAPPEPVPRRRWRAPLVYAALAGAIAVGAALWSVTGTRDSRGTADEAQTAAPPPPAGATAPSGVFLVEVAALRDPAAAAALQQKVAQTGLRAGSETQTGENAHTIRVHAGPYVTRELAEAARARLKAAGFEAKIVAK
jgi:hypothetical protein